MPGMSRKPYPTDLTEDQWERLEPLLPKPKSGTPRGGRPTTTLGNDQQDAVARTWVHMTAKLRHRNQANTPVAVLLLLLMGCCPGHTPRLG